MKFVYGFGFEAPAQRANNESHGWDDEDSGGVLIEADSEAEAREWGRAIAEAFFKWLYQNPAETWATAGYADYVEMESASRWTLDQLRHLPVVGVGQMPDLTMVSVYREPPRRR